MMSQKLIAKVFSCGIFGKEMPSHMSTYDNRSILSLRSFGPSRCNRSALVNASTGHFFTSICLAVSMRLNEDNVGFNWKLRLCLTLLIKSRKMDCEEEEYLIGARFNEQYSRKDRG